MRCEISSHLRRGAECSSYQDLCQSRIERPQFARILAKHCDRTTSSQWLILPCIPSPAMICVKWKEAQNTYPLE